MVEGFLPHVLELWDMAIQAVLQLELESGTKWINQPIAHMESPQLASLHPGKLNPSLYSLHTSVRESKVPKRICKSQTERQVDAQPRLANDATALCQIAACCQYQTLALQQLLSVNSLQALKVHSNYSSGGRCWCDNHPDDGSITARCFHERLQSLQAISLSRSVRQTHASLSNLQA